jgi:hypothetical protein
MAILSVKAFAFGIERPDQLPFTISQGKKNTRMSQNWYMLQNDAAEFK